ncbi:MAG: tRNA epoxyqueuosine(34) reductase QueG [Anaerolineales bacterium]|nr:tRNA epoxyqueuosine(34) reductase QueG [Anaerolineales bacterium]
MEALKESIRERARELGFALCGFTGAEPPEHYPLFAEWIAGGFHAGMGYLAAGHSLAARADPRRLLPAARSIIALAAPYPPPPPPLNLPLEGFVAAYALGDDYHDFLRPRLRALSEFVERAAGRRLACRIAVDTAPLLEREIASRAGLGWIGRNSMLIHPALGSFLFLAEILTELDLPPDPPFPGDRCGTCDLCRRACPTNCILPGRTIDARRCIAYWTIEHRGPIPEPLRGLLGRSVFGCDLCQTACPWNRKAAAAAEAAFLPRPHFPIGDMGGELGLTEEEWQIRFHRSALRRAGREGYLRNLIIALGNTGSNEALPALRTARMHTDPILSEAAAWSLGRIQPPKTS